MVPTPYNERTQSDLPDLKTNAKYASQILSQEVAETLKREFYANTFVDTIQVLNKIKASNVPNMVQSFFKSKYPNCEITDFNWSDRLDNRLKHGFNCTFWADRMMLGITDESRDFLAELRRQARDRYDRVLKAQQMFIDVMLTARIKGELELTDSRITNLKLLYEQETVRFFANYEFKYAISATPYRLQSGECDPTEIIMKGSYSELYHICSVPLQILSCWIKGKPDDPAEKVDKPSRVDNEYIFYGPERYPVWLCELIQAFGNQAFKKFYDSGFVKKLVYDVITEGLPQPPELPNRSNVTDQIESEPKKLEGDPEVRRLEQLAELDLEVQKRLQIIQNTTDPHTERPWARILGYEGTGGSGPFIKKMIKAGLIMKQTVPRNGFRLRLTDKALILFPSR